MCLDWSAITLIPLVYSKSDCLIPAGLSHWTNGVGSEMLTRCSTIVGWPNCDLWKSCFHYSCEFFAGKATALLPAILESMKFVVVWKSESKFSIVSKFQTPIMKFLNSQSLSIWVLTNACHSIKSSRVTCLSSLKFLFALCIDVKRLANSN